MANWFKDYSQPIGHAPLTCLNHVTESVPVLVPGKIKGRNPAIHELTTGLEDVGKNRRYFLLNSRERHISVNLFLSMFNEQGVTT